MLWLKFLHIAALSLWVGGLVYLAALLAAHRLTRDRQDHARVRLASRMAYIGLASPAAMVAIAAGAALLFVADALHPWMVLKLMAVSVLVIAHIRLGYVLAELADPEAEPPGLRLRLHSVAVIGSSLAILWLVLAKPQVPTGLIPDWVSSPGLLTPPETAPPLPLPPAPRRPS